MHLVERDETKDDGMERSSRKASPSRSAFHLHSALPTERPKFNLFGSSGRPGKESSWPQGPAEGMCGLFFIFVKGRLVFDDCFKRKASETAF